MQLRMTALAVLSAAAALCGQAKADWLYSFSGTPAWAHPGYGAPASFEIKLDITDAAMQSGAFALHGIGLTPYAPSTMGPTFTGDTVGFVSLAISGMDTATLSNFPTWDDFTVGFAFNPDGSIASDQINFQGPSDEGVITGNSGYLGSDGPWCNASAVSHKCSVSGSWTAVDPPGAPVPEPASLAVLGAGLLGLAARRWAA